MVLGATVALLTLTNPLRAAASQVVVTAGSCDVVVRADKTGADTGQRICGGTEVEVLGSCHFDPLHYAYVEYSLGTGPLYPPMPFFYEGCVLKRQLL